MWVTGLLRQVMILDPADLEGAVVIADDGEMLGKITKSAFDSKSIGNEFGEYGSRFRTKSLFNAFSKYASNFSSESAFNPSATKPPMILLKGKVVGHLTMNKAISPRADPFAVIGYVKYERL